MEKASAGGAHMLVSSIAVFELWYGVDKSTKQEFNRKRLETFLAGPILVLPFEDADARVPAQVRAALEAVGKPIGAYDLLMAGRALRRQLTLVTANVADFAGDGLAGRVGRDRKMSGGHSWPPLLTLCHPKTNRNTKGGGRGRPPHMCLPGR